MQLLIPALLLGSFIQSTAARDIPYKVKAVTETEYVTKYKTIKVPAIAKTVTYTKTIQKPPGLKDIEAYASYKGLTCIKAPKPSKTTKSPTTTDEVEESWIKNCPPSVTLTAVPKCPAIRCMADPDCPVYDEALPIEWDCRCKDRPPTTTKWVKPCPSCCPPPPIQRYDGTCLGRMSILPFFTTKLDKKPAPTVKPIAVGEPNPATPKEDEPKEDEPKEEEPKEEEPKEEEPKEDQLPPAED
ncbi:hypothetical protein TWF281_007030 [Arthrobotrys megalospora]